MNEYNENIMQDLSDGLNDSASQANEFKKVIKKFTKVMTKEIYALFLHEREAHIFKHTKKKRVYKKYLNKARKNLKENEKHDNE